MKLLEASQFLKVGDRVEWRGGWGHDSPQIAVVESIDEVEPGEKYGNAVQAMPWHMVKERAVVSLDNHHWAYGRQIEPLKEDARGIA